MVVVITGTDRTVISWYGARCSRPHLVISTSILFSRSALRKWARSQLPPGILILQPCCLGSYFRFPAPLGSTISLPVVCEGRFRLRHRPTSGRLLVISFVQCRVTYAAELNRAHGQLQIITLGLRTGERIAIVFHNVNGRNILYGQYPSQYK